MALPDFDLKVLSQEDGSWDAFKTDWAAQSAEVGEDFDEYAPSVISVLEDIVTGDLPSAGGTNTTVVGALWDASSARYYAACMLNRVMLPKTPGYTLRVRHLVVSPLIDYGASEIEMYPDVVIGVTLGIVNLSASVLPANNIHLHLRSPEDMTFFRAFGVALGAEKIFASVQTKGAWLYIEKVGAAPASPMEE